MNEISHPRGTGTLWGASELVLRGPADGNPFLEVTLAATFTHGTETRQVQGFHDGEGIYRVRFLPELEGIWHYRTSSNVPALHGVSGELHVRAAREGDHGPVRVADTFHFRHADGTRYLNIGTTAYAWTHQGDAREEETLATLRDAPFTKIRMCVFPKHYRYNQNEPERYPFAVLKRGASQWPGTIESSGWHFDYDRPDPAYFRHLETRIRQLGEIGVEADLILLHPYDRWGFSQMTAEQDDRYLRYVVSRLAAFPNVWWSMANEYDFMENKSLEDWNRMIDVTANADPHGHLLSIHNAFPHFDWTDPRLTHVSIQRPDTELSILWREQYGKPVSVDECCYEGDISEQWGNISGLELVDKFWLGIVNGGYVTHGETYYNDEEVLFWAKGGQLTGSSVARIAFLRKILEAGPDRGLDPVLETRNHRILKIGADNTTGPEMSRPAPGEESWSKVRFPYPIACDPHRYYLTYFSYRQPREITVPTPPGETYAATLLDVWNMVETPLAGTFTRGEVILVDPKPYQAIVLQRLD
ncbi:MAG: DUF5060 domain-containing protein [Devosia sp.]